MGRTVTFTVTLNDASWSITDAKLYDALPETMSRDQVWDLLHHDSLEAPAVRGVFDPQADQWPKGTTEAEALAALRGGDTHDS